MKFYTFQSGEILINNFSLPEIDTASYRNQIGYVPQEVMLFSGTIAENITIGNKESTLEDVIKSVPGTSSEYRAKIEHEDGKDKMTVYVEVEMGVDRVEVELGIKYVFKQKYNMTPEVVVVGIGELPRSEKKTKRIEDLRFE